MFQPKNILIVAAHPDDEILGCGGAIARLVREGARAVTLILGEGITSRDGDEKSAKSALKELREQAVEANRRVGVDEVIFRGLPDNRFDTVSLLEIVKEIEGVMARLRPDLVLTHHRGDLNIDHQITHQAVLTAARPLPGASVRAIFAFEVLSSTEWSPGPVPFSPNLYVDVSETLRMKVEAMEAYAGEIRVFPHPRSRRGIEALAARRGAEVGVAAAEAFDLVRGIL